VTNPSLIHQALLYEDVQQFLDAVLPFIREGVDRGEPVLAVATTTNSGLLRDELGQTATNVKFVDPAQWYDAPGRTMAACHRYVRAVRSGQERVRVIGEPVWAGWNALETAGWKRFEASLNIAFAAAPAWMICSYDQRALPPEVITAARRTHPQFSGGTPSGDYDDPMSLYTSWEADLPPAPKGRYSTLWFDGDPAPVRHFTVVEATRLGLAPNLVDDLVLAVNEVATNAIRHGAGHGEVRIWHDEQFLLCEVFDPGNGADASFSYLPPNPDSEHGHGLWITRQLCDLVEIRAKAGGTTVRMYMRRG
jgi:anti-sigma regulatory factor (Ser/Thr protein kinase)